MFLCLTKHIVSFRNKILYKTNPIYFLVYSTEIYYSLLNETEQFAIHPSSGVLTLTRSLATSGSTYYQLTVLATDRASLLLNNVNSNFKSNHYTASKASVEIFVQHTNLHAPEIYVQALNEIVENSNANIYGIVRVEDRDSGIHGEIKSLEIVDGDPDGHFRIKPSLNAGEFVIEIHKLLDRETTPAGYNLTLRAVDKGVPPKDSYKRVPVRLLDYNDNYPIFNKELYEISVPEVAPINTPVIRLKGNSIYNLFPQFFIYFYFLCSNFFFSLANIQYENLQ